MRIEVNERKKGREGREGEDEGKERKTGGREEICVWVNMLGKDKLL